MGRGSPRPPPSGACPAVGKQRRDTETVGNRGAERRRDLDKRLEQAPTRPGNARNAGSRGGDGQRREGKRTARHQHQGALLARLVVKTKQRANALGPRQKCTRKQKQSLLTSACILVDVEQRSSKANLSVILVSPFGAREPLGAEEKGFAGRAPGVGEPRRDLRVSERCLGSEPCFPV